MRLRSLTLAVALLASTSTAAMSQAVPATAFQAAGTAAPAAQTEDQRLAAFFDQAFQEAIALSPETLTQLGMKDRYAELGDYTERGEQVALDLAEAQLARMKREFDFDRLSEESKVSWRLFEYTVDQQRLQRRWRWHQYVVANTGTVAGQIPVLLINAHRVSSVADAEAYVSRLNAVERVMGEVAADIRERTRRGFVSPTFVYAPVLSDTRQVIAGAPFAAGADTPLWADFKAKVEALDAEPSVKARLLAEAEAALKGPFRRGYESFLAAVEEASRAATHTDGVWRLPDGAAYYEQALEFFTSTEQTADQIHDRGLSEVARIQSEMEAVKRQVGFTGTLQEFFAHVKTSPQFQYANDDAGKQQYLQDAQAMIDAYMAVAPTQFSRLPRGPVEVRAVEAWREKTAPVAFYNPGTPDGSRPGIYYVNLSDMTQVLKPQIEAITYHEAAPGHHFQIAFSQELEGLPMFRRYGFHGAYIEGWGLYAELLGKEAGFYRDPYSDFGRLSLELWRAARMVVDTGIHHKRWSRDQAIDYFRRNTLLSERDIQKEVDRYITTPGQATSYKVGQLEILALRERARRELGPKFDIRQFHEVVLGSGPLPLGVLAEKVDAWIARTR